jgi:hypothetical protein
VLFGGWSLCNCGGESTAQALQFGPGVVDLFAFGAVTIAERLGEIE